MQKENILEITLSAHYIKKKLLFKTIKDNLINTKIKLSENAIINTIKHNEYWEIIDQKTFLIHKQGKKVLIYETNWIEKYLRIFKNELLGKIIIDKFKISIPVVSIFLIFVFFGILLILHTINKTPLPVSLKDAFSNPSGNNLYYPNLIGIVYDLIGNPAFFIFILIFHNYICKQFSDLQKNMLIKERKLNSKRIKFLRLITTKPIIQKILIIWIPIIGSTIFTVLWYITFKPATLPYLYSTLLTFLGHYAVNIVIIKLIYTYLTLYNFEFTNKIIILHPDKCSGYSSFGNIAIAIYIFLFFWAMFQAVGISAGGSAIDYNLKNILHSNAYFYLWLLFPFILILILNKLIFKPHKIIKDTKNKKLEENSIFFNKRYFLTFSQLIKNEKSKNTNLKNNIELIDNFTKLNQFYLDIFNWPISKTKISIITTIGNPLIPILLPTIIDFLKSIL